MRRNTLASATGLLLRLAPGFLLALAPGSAFALDQPDGTPIPQGNGLQGLFDMRGETINALAQAADQPETFTPGCSLTFTVLQRNAGYQNAFGWYNVTGSAPALSDLHEFIPCSDPLGTIVPLPNIQSDPGYLGGEIGFYEGVVTSGCTASSDPSDYAYVFYSEPQFNPDGNQANPYIHLLIYNSTVTSNAFYFGWEDLVSGGDNDFDDLTAFVTGITCTGGGAACQTGQPGVCGAGTMQCQNGMLVCLPLVPPGPESCNGFDDDCNGSIDDGDLCQANEVCDNGVCVPSCGSGEFQCAADKVCDTSKGVCVDAGCVGIVCPEGTKCIEGDCLDPCAGVVCPGGQVCIAGVCLDPCAAITCDATQVCEAGACVEKCDCAGCPAGKECQSTGLCLDAACVGVDCPEGQVCQSDGTCKDECDDVICPAGQICTTGACVTDPNSGEGGGGGGILLAGSGGGTASGMGGSSSGGRSASGGSGGAGADGNGGDSGCSCEVAGGSMSSAGGWGALALLMALSRRRRR